MKIQYVNLAAIICLTIIAALVFFIPSKNAAAVAGQAVSAKDCVKIVKQIKGVKDCSVKLRGQTLIVNVDADDTAQNHDLLKQQISAALKNYNPRIKKIVVSLQFDMQNKIFDIFGKKQPPPTYNTDLGGTIDGLTPAGG